MAIRTPRGADQRYKRWEKRFAKTTPPSQSLSPAMERMTQDPDKVIPNATRNAFNEMMAMETEVRGVLNVSGVPVITYPFYLNFGRELWKLSGRVAGAALYHAGCVLRGKWAARGLIVPVLDQIAALFYTAVLPAGVRLEKPANLAENVPLDALLEWALCEGAVTFNVWFAAGPILDPAPTPVLVATGVTLREWDPPLVASRHCAWRIVGVNPYGQGPSSVTWTFKTIVV